MSKTSNFIQDTIYSTVQERIRNGVYRDGEKLSENSLAKEFKCSRTPVREVFQKLEQNGLVVIQPKSGTYVRHYSKKEIIDALEIRSYLEALAFNLDIEKKVDLTPLKECLAEMNKVANVKPLDIEKFGLAHFNFHSLLVSLADNPFLTDVYNQLHLIALYGVFFKPMAEDDLKITQEEHEKIVDLLEKGDKSGESFIIHHLIRRREDFAE